MTDRPEHLQYLRVMRGIAAMIVVVYHCAIIVRKNHVGGAFLDNYIFDRGWIGVNFFFVLSGFIILHAHRADIGRARALPHYLWRRVIRVYPIYWIVTAFFIIAAACGLGTPNFSWEPMKMASALTLLPLGVVPNIPLKVAWTLYYEIAFYGAFAVLILNRRVGFALFAAWLCYIGYDAVLATPHRAGLPPIWSLHFFFGMLAYAVYRQGSTSAGPFAVMAGVALLGVAMAMGWIGSTPRPTFIPVGEILLLCVAFMLITGGAALAERGRRLTVPRLPALLGDASYSIYLTHSAVVSAIVIVIDKLGLSQLHALILFPVALAGSTASGLLVYRLVEKPILTKLHGVLRNRQGRPAPATSIVSSL